MGRRKQRVEAHQKKRTVHQRRRAQHAAKHDGAYDTHVGQRRPAVRTVNAPQAW